MLPIGEDLLRLLDGMPDTAVLVIRDGLQLLRPSPVLHLRLLVRLVLHQGGFYAKPQRAGGQQQQLRAQSQSQQAAAGSEAQGAQQGSGNDGNGGTDSAGASGADQLQQTLKLEPTSPTQPGSATGGGGTTPVAAAAEAVARGGSPAAAAGPRPRFPAAGTGPPRGLRFEVDEVLHAALAGPLGGVLASSTTLAATNRQGRTAYPVVVVQQAFVKIFGYELPINYLGVENIKQLLQVRVCVCLCVCRLCPWPVLECFMGASMAGILLAAGYDALVVSMCRHGCHWPLS